MILANLNSKIKKNEIQILNLDDDVFGDKINIDDNE